MSTIRDQQTVRVPSPPDFGKANPWVLRLADEVNNLPPFSTFSFSTPESNVTAQAPMLGFNYASNVSVLWVKETGSGNTGWRAL